MPPSLPTTTEHRRRKRPVITAQELLESGWVAYQHPEGEGYPNDHPGWDRLAAAVERQSLADRLRPVAYGTLAALALCLLSWAWVVVGRAALAGVGLYPAPQSTRGGTR